MEPVGKIVATTGCPIRFARIIIAIVISLLAVAVGLGPVVAGQVVLAWDANQEADLSGYKLYQGTTSGSYETPINVGEVTTYTVAGLAVGQTYYFAVTACDTNGNESGYSNEVSYTVPGNGARPMEVTIASPTAGALIRYTTDGSTPSATVGTELKNGGAVTIDRSLTLKAIAYKPGWIATPVMQATYTLRVDPVTTASPTENTLMRETTDGAAPSATVGMDLKDGGVVTGALTQQQ